MTARRTPPAEPPRTPGRCARCRQHLQPDRALYCSVRCIEADDARAAELADQVAGLDKQLARQRAELDAQLRRFTFERHRVLDGIEDAIARAAAELAPLRDRLTRAKATGEARWALTSDNAPHASENAWGPPPNPAHPGHRTS